jgi:hypothetical protein
VGEWPATQGGAASGAPWRWVAARVVAGASTVLAAACGGQSSAGTGGWSAGSDAGTIVLLASQEQWPTTGAIAVGPTGVYWSATNGSKDTNSLVVDLFQVPLAGGAVRTLASGAYGGSGIAIENGRVYWTGAPSGGVVSLADSRGADDLATSTTNAYWTTGASGNVFTAALDGGAATLLFAGRGVQVALGIAVDATSVYWTVQDQGTVLKVSLDGGAATTLASQQEQPTYITVDDTSIYWTDSNYAGGGTGFVMKLPLGASSAAAPIVIASGRVTPWNVVVDATSVYWTDEGTDGSQIAIMKAPLDGGVATTVASGPRSALLTGIAVDATSVYWTTEFTVLKLTPK